MPENGIMDLVLGALAVAPWVVGGYLFINAVSPKPLPGLKRLSSRFELQDLSTAVFIIVLIFAFFYATSQVLQFFV